MKVGVYIGVFMLFLGAFCAPAPALAQSADATSTAGAVASRQVQLQQQLDQLDAQSTQLQSQIAGLEGQKVSLTRDISILKAQIAQAQLQIKARNLVIQQLTAGIADKQSTIVGLNSQLQAELVSLAGLMRQKNDLEQSSLVVIAFSSQTLSEFLSDLDTVDQINEQMQRSFTQIQDTKTVTQKQKDDLQAQKDEETQLLQVQQLQQQQIKAQQAQEQQILSETNGKESAYQTLLTANQKTAAQIRAELFQLTGAKGISFGTAYQYALQASKSTGIRPAFLLGVIREESGLGANVGTGTFMVDSYQCYLNFGSPTNAAKQLAAFNAITRSLGLSPGAMPVSKKPSYGCGGAMGPAQFISSTWALYAGYPAPAYAYDSSKDRIGKLTGNTPPNPWSPQDAFMAAALYLTDSGAGAQSTSAEFKAAMCYLAGCGQVNNRSLQFYGNSVATFAAQYQQEIDVLAGS